MNTYRIRYTFRTPDWQGREPRQGQTDFTCSAPVTALNQFHAFMQKAAELDGNRNVIRPRLKPDEYTLLSLHQVYHDCGFQPDVTRTPVVESKHDLPRTGNPNLNPEPSAVAEQAEMELGV